MGSHNHRGDFHGSIPFSLGFWPAQMANFSEADKIVSCTFLCMRSPALAYFGGLPAVFPEIAIEEVDEEVAWLGMIEEVLPARIASADAFSDPADVLLFPEEEAIVSAAAEKRRRDSRPAQADALAVGLDAEPDLPLPDLVLGAITVPPPAPR